MFELTVRQSEIHEFIRRCTSVGPAPTYRDIAAEFGININAVAGHLRALRRKKILTWQPGRARTLVVCRPS